MCKVILKTEEGWRARGLDGDGGWGMGPGEGQGSPKRQYFVPITPLTLALEEHRGCWRGQPMEATQ